MIRKLILILLILTGKFWSAGAQEYPRYSEVLYKLFEKYSLTLNSDKYNYLIKNTKGWELGFYKFIDSTKELVLDSSKIFWDKNSGMYYDLPLKKNETNLTVNEIYENYVFKYLLSIEQFTYDLLPYYQVNAKTEKTIEHLESNLALTPSEQHALARLYELKFGKIVYPFLYDPNTLYLDRKEVPQTVIDSAELFMNKSLELYSQLSINHPDIMSFINPIKMKMANTCVHAWNIFMMLNKPKLAQQYLNQANYSKEDLESAKTQLKFLPKSSILITAGDNETYTIWYVQQKLNYRKDVTVIVEDAMTITRYLNLNKTHKQLSKLSEKGIYQGTKINSFKYYHSDSITNFNFRKFMGSRSFRDSFSKIKDGKYQIKGKHKLHFYINYWTTENSILLAKLISSYGENVFITSTAIYYFRSLSFKKTQCQYQTYYDTSSNYAENITDTQKIIKYYEKLNKNNKDPQFFTQSFRYLNNEMFSDFIGIAHFYYDRNETIKAQKYLNWAYAALPKTGYFLDLKYRELLLLAKEINDSNLCVQITNNIVNQLNQYYCANKYYLEHLGRYYNARKEINDIEEILQSIKKMLDENQYITEYNLIENALIDIQTTCRDQNLSKDAVLKLFE